MQKYKFLEDVAIADIAYEAYGRDLNELFESAALAIFELSADLKSIDPIQKIEFGLGSDTIEHLLYDFLSEILFLKDSKYMVFKKAKVSISGEKQLKLKAILEGDTINPQKQRLENDIKAVTMHMFQVKKEKRGYKS